MKLNIKRALVERNMTVEELGQLLGISRSTIFDKLSRNNPSVSELLEIARVLNCDITDLFDSTSPVNFITCTCPKCKTKYRVFTHVQISKAP